ncbi:MAG: ABC transporter permease [Eubacteriales bacterium]|nr:ABC transporter permease [Eubacteriales bacterium]
MKKINFNSRSLFALPYVIYMTIFVVIPLFMLLFFAFFGEGSFSFAEIGAFFTDGSQWATVGRSLRIALVASLWCILIGYPLAYAIAKIKSKTVQYMILMAVVAPMWINGLLRTVALKDFITTITDLIANIADTEIDPTGETLLTLGLIIDYLPFMLMPIYLVITGISKSYLEVSADLGASPFITFFKVTLPLSMSGIISGFLMVFTPAVSTYYMSEYLGNQSTFMIGEQLNTMFTKDNKSGAAVIALVLLVLVGVSVFIANQLSRIGNNKKGGIA